MRWAGSFKPWYVWRPWQIARRLRLAWVPPPDSYQEARTAWGVTLRVNPSMTLGWSVEATGIHDLAVTETLARLIRPGDTVLDVGAHIGYTAVLAALAARPDGRVIAWEPHPDLFRVLQENVSAAAAQHHLATLSLRNAALGSHAGSADLIIPAPDSRNDATSHLAEADNSAGRSIRVAVETLDEVMENTPIGVMKLDVEGTERQALEGAAAALAQHRIRDIVFEDHQAPSSDVVRFLTSMRYEIFALGWTVRGLRLEPVARGALAKPYEAPNFVATIAPRDVLKRCAAPGWTTLRARFASGPSSAPSRP